MLCSVGHVPCINLSHLPNQDTTWEQEKYKRIAKAVFNPVQVLFPRREGGKKIYDILC